MIKVIFRVLLYVLPLAALYLSTLHGYLLFHSLVESFSGVVAIGIFMVAWNARRMIDNGFFLFIGISYLFVGFVGFLHAFAYKGMGVFPGYGADLPTQLWVAARYLEAASFLVATFFIGRRVAPLPVIALFSAVTALLLMSIFSWKAFPACFVEGSGLTAFKIASEYAISLVLAVSAAILYRRRGEFDPGVFRLVEASIAITVLSEMSFTLYADVYGAMNLLGHFFMLASFYLLYKAFIETGLMKPYAVLFRNLTLEKDRAKNYLDVAGVMMVVIGADQRVSLINRKGCEVLGYAEGEIVGRNWFDNFLPERLRGRVKGVFDSLIAGEVESAEYFENPVLARAGEERIIAWHNTVMRDAKRGVAAILCSGEDITERRRAEEGFRWELSVRKAAAGLSEELINPSLSLPDISGTVLRHALSLTGSMHGFVSSIDPATGDVVSHTLTAMMDEAQCGVRGERRGIVFPRGADGRYPGLWGHALNTREAFYSNSPSSHEAARGVPEGHIPVRNFLTAPALVGDDLMGLMAVANSVADYEGRDLEAVKQLARLYAFALFRKRMEDELRASVHEKEMLVRESHHRVKNNLAVISSLLRLQSGSVEDEKARGFITESRSRVQAMSLIHEKLYRSADMKTINFREYASDLAARLFRAYDTGGGKVSLDTEIDDVALDVDTVIPCGLILNEIVTNALKHAFPGGRAGRLKVKFHRSGESRYVLVVRDDGVGFPEGLDFRGAATMGMQIVTSLAAQLDGGIELLREGGTEFRVTFTVEEIRRENAS